MAVQLPVWVRTSVPKNILISFLDLANVGKFNYLVDLGGSLAVASRGLFATGVSTDLNGRQLQNPMSCSH